MGEVFRLAGRGRRGILATLVLVDLHEFAGVPPAAPELESQSKAVVMCRAALAFARETGMPIAFLRRVPALSSLLSTPAIPKWISGIEPRRNEMVFARETPSGYGSSQFARMAQSTGELVLAGLFGESSCLSTLVEAHHRRHPCTLLGDASCSSANDSLSAAERHVDTLARAALYGRVAATEDWLVETGKGRSREGFAAPPDKFPHAAPL